MVDVSTQPPGKQKPRIPPPPIKAGLGVENLLGQDGEPLWATLSHLTQASTLDCHLLDNCWNNPGKAKGQNALKYTTSPQPLLATA